MIRTSSVMMVAALALGLSACTKPPVKPVPTPTPQPVVVIEKNSYIVKPGDNLWTIAGKKKVLKDSFQWPLLFKANRDQIEDPDLIEPKQDLGYKKAYSKEEADEAVKKAKETPPFVPHKAPRKVLPVQY